MQKRKWTEAEDAVLREYSHHVASWDGFARVLPGRSKKSIQKRRERLGINPAVTGVRPKVERANVQRLPPPVPSNTWTSEQRTSLVNAATQMVDECGHSIGECVRELVALVVAYKRGALA